MSFIVDVAQNVLLSIPLVGAYVVFALGIVVIFRASRVLNLAHGAMAMAPAYVYFQLSTRLGVPVPVALVAAVAAGALLGYGVERVFVRPLARVSATAQTVGTIAAFGLILAVVAKVFGTLTFEPKGIFPDTAISIGSASLRGGAIGLFVVGLLVATGLHLLFQRTHIGLGMRAVAESPRAASLMGINPQRMVSMAWMLGGGTAAMAGILLAATTNLHPYTLALQALPGFVSALLGGLGSLVGAVAGAAVVGTLIGVVPVLPGLGRAAGAPQLMLMIITFVTMALRGQRFAASDVRSDGIASEPPRRAPARARAGSRRRADLVTLGIVLLLLFPALPGVNASLLGTADLALIYAVVGISLVLLTGLVGQISLAHASFVGIAAFVTGRVISLMPFPLNLPIAAAAAAALAVALGMVALRVRGLYLAVATLIFAWMTDAYLFQQSWLVGIGGSTSFEVPTLGPTEGFPHFDFTERRTFYYIGLAAVAAVAGSVALLRQSKTGRAFFAVRGSEVAAASLGIDITRYKLLAFGLSGAVAGIAGNLLAAHSGVVVTSQFTFNISLFFLGIAVVGGLTSVGGAIAAGALFAGLNEVFFRVQALSGFLEIISAGLLAAVLLAYPAGLSGIPAGLARFADRLRPHLERTGLRDAARRATAAWARLVERAHDTVRRRVAAWRERPSPEGPTTPLQRLLAPLAQRPEAPDETAGAAVPGDGAVATGNGSPAAGEGVPLALAEPDDARARGANVRSVPRDERSALLEVHDLSMHFGGLKAVSGVSMSVREGEITGLIGPNGAGKTTVFNCVSGLLRPTAGRVVLFGRDVTEVPVHERTTMGLGRTFQVIQLFPQLTVFENLLIATHPHNPTGVVSHLFMTRRSLSSERDARRAVRQVAGVLGLTEELDRPAEALPFGRLRMVELARALLTGARLIMLDEPASGLDSMETHRFAELLLGLRAALGLTFLVIEHDVRFVTSVTDHIYVLDQGGLLADGSPADIQRNPEVVAAYLGEAREPALA